MPERDVTDLLSSGMPEESLAILRALGEIADGRGVGAFVVGGVVRDLLLGIGNFDLDVVVEEAAPEFADRAAALLGGSVKAHTRFGTAILVLPGGRKVDVATARREAYERPGALPTVSAGSIIEDLRRRDFTINSMAVRLNAVGFGTLVDEFGGEADLEAGVLRVLTDRSFADDPTRILRGVRFAARFSSRFEERTEALLREAIENDSLSTVSGERIMNEIVLILSEPDPCPPVQRMIGWGILPAIHDEWVVPIDVSGPFATIGALVGEGSRVVGLDEADPWRVYLAVMLLPLRPEARVSVLGRLSAGRRLHAVARHLERFEREAAAVVDTRERVRPSAVYGALEGLSTEALLAVAAAHGSLAVRERVDRFLCGLRGVSVSLTGSDLVALGVPQGPRVGEILRALLEARLDGAVTSDDEERALAEKLARELDAGHKSC
jgi:tRNA nucleotidyltransferase (CCA-adding enzyme)